MIFTKFLVFMLVHGGAVRFPIFFVNSYRTVVLFYHMKTYETDCIDLLGKIFTKMKHIGPVKNLLLVYFMTYMHEM